MRNACLFIAVIVLVILQGCAHIEIEKIVKDEEGNLTTIEVEHYLANRKTTDMIMGNSIRLQDSAAAAQVAIKSVQEGYPTVFGANPYSIDASSGGKYPSFDGYPTHGMPYSSYYGLLPVRIEGVSESITLPTKTLTLDSCPKDREPETDAERIACLEQNHDILADHVYQKKESKR